MADRDYYEILGVSPDADGAAVHRTYWQIARKYQAQAPSDPRSRRLLDDLNEAYNVLGTPHLRTAYDATYEPRAEAKRGVAGVRHSSSNGIRALIPWGRKRAEEPGQPIARMAPAQPARSRPSGVDDLRLSTASIVGRWRKNAAPDVLRDGQTPDTTLVDIFKSERDLEEPEEPLTAVLDVLRGSRETANLR